MGQHKFSVRQVTYWALILVTAAFCFAFHLSLRAQHRDAGRTAEILRPLLAAEPRFAKVQVTCATNARVFLRGHVGSAADLTALRALADRAGLPMQPIFAVRVETPSAQHLKECS